MKSILELVSKPKVVCSCALAIRAQRPESVESVGKYDVFETTLNNKPGLLQQFV